MCWGAEAVLVDTDTIGVGVQWSETSNADDFAKNLIRARCEGGFGTSVTSEEAEKAAKRRCGELFIDWQPLYAIQKAPTAPEGRVRPGHDRAGPLGGSRRPYRQALGLLVDRAQALGGSRRDVDGELGDDGVLTDLEMLAGIGIPRIAPGGSR